MKKIIDTENPEVMNALIDVMIAKTPVAYIILDRQFRVHFINDYFLKLRKLKEGDVLGTYCYNVSNRGVPCAQCAVRTSIKTGKNQFITRKDVLPDGTIRYMDDYAVPLYKEDGTFDFILEMMINRTSELTIRDDMNKLFLDMVDTLVSIIEKKDRYTSTHSRDVSTISTKLAQYVGFSEEDLFLVTLSGLLHDIGKIQIPDAIINKNGKLDDEEFNCIKKHPTSSFDILSQIRQFDLVREGAKYHHERWDGRGYPERLAGDVIPKIARIIGIADTYDAMTSTRSYRKALTHENALDEIHKNAGTQFDPELAEKFIEMATDWYPNRQALISKNDTVAVPKMNIAQQVERQISSSNINVKTSPTFIDDKSIASLMYDNFFVKEIFKYSPVYYILVDDSFNVIYVSDSVTKDMNMTKAQLLSMRCFEVNDKKTSCFAVEKGVLKCPVVRAFQTGTDQVGKVTEKFGETQMHFDIYAVPLELKDINGETFKCAMEMLVDRTEEVNIQKAMESDIKNIVTMLYDLASNIDDNNTAGSRDIMKECISFGEYLNKMKDTMKELEQ